MDFKNVKINKLVALLTLTLVLTGCDPISAPKTPQPSTPNLPGVMEEYQVIIRTTPTDTKKEIVKPITLTVTGAPQDGTLSFLGQRLPATVTTVTPFKYRFVIEPGTGEWGFTVSATMVLSTYDDGGIGDDDVPRHFSCIILKDGIPMSVMDNAFDTPYQSVPVQERGTYNVSCGASGVS